MRKLQVILASTALAVGTIACAQQAGTADDGVTPRDAANQVNTGRSPMPRDNSGTVARDPVTGDTSARPMPSDTDASARGSVDARGNAQANAQADREHLQMLQKIASEPNKAADRLFVHHAAAANLYEVEFARIANERSNDQQIKQLAQHIIQDHTQANQRLATAAKDLDLTIPTALPSSKQAVLNVYRSMPVKNLETCFLVENKASHAKAVTSYSDHTKTVQNEKLRAYVTETLPKLQQHTQRVVQAAQAKGIQGDIAMQSPGNTGGGMQSTSTDNR